MTIKKRDLKKVRLGQIHADVLTFAEAIEEIGAVIRSGEGGYVVTPNVDHVCLAESSAELRAAYDGAALSLVDGMPLVWLGKLLGHPFPGKISGSDLLEPLVARAAQEGWSVYFLGARPGVGKRASDILASKYPGLKVAGVVSPPLGFDEDAAARVEVNEQIRRSGANIVFVALGCPKQELWMTNNSAELGGAVSLGIGASLDFVAGEVKRCPHWISRIGAEWLYRLSQEPRRMASRYLVRDRAIVRIAWRMWRTPHRHRALGV